MLVLILACFFRVFACLEIQGLYYEIKPYVFHNSKGVLDGVIPQAFRLATFYCANQTSSVLTFKKRFSSLLEFKSVLMSNVSYGEGKLREINDSKPVAWAPDFTNIAMTEPRFFQQRNMTEHSFFSSQSAAVVVRRREIELLNKLWRAVSHCKVLVLYVVLLLVPVSICLWLFEREANEDFQNDFVNGSMEAMWWGMVTMTTLGYGDIVPKTFLGRLVGILWMMVGLVFMALLVATMTNSVSGVDNVADLEGRTVSVLNASYEEEIATSDFNALVKVHTSYDDCIEAVKRGESYAAIINSDVAAHIQNQMKIGEPLSIVATVGVHIPVQMYFSCNAEEFKELRDFLDCFAKNHQKNMLYWIEKKYRKQLHITHLHIGTVKNAFSNLFAQVTVALAFLCIILGIVIPMIKRSRH